MAKEIPADTKYWAERAVQLNEAMLEQGDEFYQRLVNAYDLALERIEKEINAFYQQFAVDNAISYADAKKALTSSEKKRFMLDINDYLAKAETIGYSDEWLEVLNNASTAHRVTRLQSLKIQMCQQVEELSSKYDKGLTETVTQIFNDSYYQSIFEQQKMDGYFSPFAKLDTESVKTVVNSPWTQDGTNFSERIWKNRTDLVNFLNKEMVQSFIRGDSPGSMMKKLVKKFGVSNSNAARLVQTESAFFSGRAKIESYKRVGYTKYIIIAVMDAKTSAVCRDMDGEVIGIEDYMPGVNAPPFHPRCRSTIAPFESAIRNKQSSAMARNPVTDKVERIPSGLSFKEWYAKCVSEE